jgi:hypothetical protein
VVEDGVTGVLTPPGDVDALVAALEPLMRDPASAAAMGERARARARARVLEKFSLDAEANGSRRFIARWSEPSRRRQTRRGRRLRTGSPAARGFRRLDIGRAVADDKTAFAPHRPVLHQIVDHAGLGLRQ